MVKALRGYFVFAGWGYRIMIWLVVPGIMIGADCLMDIWQPDAFGFAQIACMVMYGVLLVIAETIGEYWFLAGINSRKRKCMEYLKTSNEFIGCIKSVLMVDLVRRIITIGLVFFVMGNFDIQTAEGLARWGEKSACMCMVMAVAQTAVWIARHMVMINFVFLTGYLSGIVTFFLMLLTLNFPVVCGVIAAAYVVGFSVFSVWYTLRRVKGGYYDKRFKIRV